LLISVAHGGDDHDKAPRTFANPHLICSFETLRQKRQPNTVQNKALGGGIKQVSSGVSPSLQLLNQSTPYPCNRVFLRANERGEKGEPDL
jgi:hypothetical protein